MFSLLLVLDPKIGIRSQREDPDALMEVLEARHLTGGSVLSMTNRDTFLTERLKGLGTSGSAHLPAAGDVTSTSSPTHDARSIGHRCRRNGAVLTQSSRLGGHMRARLAGIDR